LAGLGALNRAPIVVHGGLVAGAANGQVGLAEQEPESGGGGSGYGRPKHRDGLGGTTA